MLHILLMILKVIGILLLIILSILILVILLVLLVPIRYEVKAGMKNDIRKFKVHADVSWLMRFLHIQLRLKDMRIAWRVKILWFTVLQEGFELPDQSKGKVTDHERKSRKDPDDDEELERELAKLEAEYVAEKLQGESGESEHATDRSGEGSEIAAASTGDLREGRSGESSADSTESEGESGSGEDSADSTGSEGEGGHRKSTDDVRQPEDSDQREIQYRSEDEEEISEETRKTEEDPGKKEKETDEKNDEEGKSLSEKITSFFENISQKIREFNEKKEKITDLLTNKDHHKALSLAKHEIWILVKHYIPRYADIELRYGFEDPYYTGLLTAILSVIYALSRGHVYGQPYFDQKVLKGRIEIKGHIRLIWVLFAAIRLLLSRSVRATYHNIKNFEL